MATLLSLTVALKKLQAIKNQSFPTPPISTSISMDDSSSRSVLKPHQSSSTTTTTTTTEEEEAAAAAAAATKITESSSIKHAAFSSCVSSNPNKQNNTSELKLQICAATKITESSSIKHAAFSSCVSSNPNKQNNTSVLKLQICAPKHQMSTRSDKTLLQQQEQQQNQTSFFALDIFKQTAIYDALCPIIHELNEQKIVPHANLFLVCNDLLKEYQMSGAFPLEIKNLMERLEIKDEHIIRGLQQLKP